MRRRNASHLGETPRDPWRFVFCNRQACCARHCNPSRTCHGSMEGRGGGEHGSWAVVKRLRQGARASDHQGPAASSIRRVSMRACSNPTQITSFSVYYHDIIVTFLSREQPLEQRVRFRTEPFPSKIGDQSPSPPSPSVRVL